MTNIQLTKPAANQTQTVTSASDARFVLDFNTGDAQLAKSENGENLIITFEDGAKIEVEGFYTAFNKDNLPTLSVNGQDITGDQLTAILGEDLMPAAGPAASAVANAGGSNASFADPSLDGGINRLDGLDIGFDDAAAVQTPLEGAGLLPGQAGTVVAAAPEVATPEGVVAAPPVAPVTPVAPSTPSTPDTPPVETPEFKAVDDTFSKGIMNTRTSHSLLENDTAGGLGGKSVTSIDGDGGASDFGSLVQSGDALTLTLDSSKLEAALYTKDTVNKDGSQTLNGVWNIANKVAMPEGSFTVNYEADSEEYEGETFKDTASATFTVGNNDEFLAGDGGNDVAWVAGNKGVVNTEGGNDLIVVANNIKGGSIDAGGGADKLYLGSTEAGSTATGGAGNDLINVSGTNEGTIMGGGGNDTITVNENAGTIIGSENTYDTVKIDVLEGHKDGIIAGGAGADYVTLRGGSSSINLGEGDDKVNLRGDDMDHWWGGMAKLDGNGRLIEDFKYFQDAYDQDAQNATVYGGDGMDTLQTSDGTHNNVLYGGAGADRLDVFDVAYGNTLYGGNGPGGEYDNAADTLLARRWAHDNELYGEGGNDVLIAQEFAHHNTLEGGDGNDLLIAQGLSFSAASGEGTDGETGAKLTGNAYENELHGGDGADRLFALSGAQDNLLDGGGGNDYLYAGGNGYFGSGVSAQAQLGNKAWSNSDYETTGNILNGGAGNDTLEVGNGAKDNILNGDAGNDLFIAQNLTVLENNDFHGGEGTDVLVAKGLSLDGDLLRSLLEAGDVTGMEAIVTKGNVSSVQQLLNKSGVSQNDDGTIAINGSGWKSGETQTFNVDGGTVDYQEYSNGDLTLLVAQNIAIANTGGGA